MAHAGGRPVEYNQDVCTRAEEYLASCVDHEYTRIKTEGTGSTTYENFIKVELPTIEGLSIHLGITRETVYDWKGKYPMFSDIVSEIMAEQAKRLLNNGIAGTYNASIAKLMLTKHGYVEKSDFTTNGKDLPSPILGGVALEKDEVHSNNSSK